MRFVFMFYEGMTALDLIGPHEILCRLPGVQTIRVARHAGWIRCDSGIALNATSAFSDISQADYLMVPGAGNATSLRDEPQTLDWIRSIHRTTTWTTAVCSGTLILGAAGLLKGVKATTHWAVHDRLLKFGAQPVNARVVEDGKIMTGAGVTAGIDMALTLASRIAGTDVARALQLGIEYDPHPPFPGGHPSKADPALVAAVRARMERTFVD